MKKLILAFLFSFLLTGCGIQTVEQYEQMEEEERSQEEVVTKPLPEEQSVIKPEPIIQEQEEVVEQDEQEPQKKEEEKPVEQKPVTSTEQQANVSETKPATQQPAAQKSNEQKPAQQSTAQKPAVQTPKPAEPAKRYVTISIQVHSLLKHWDMLHPSLQSEQYVPSSGFILTPKKYELLSEKDTVWNVLQRAVKEHGIHLEYEGANENIYNNVYIEGINHLYEFSAGPLSGWMYRVNGVYPNYGCSQYVLEDGDIIEWHYTVDLGRDLGADGA